MLRPRAPALALSLSLACGGEDGACPEALSERVSGDAAVRHLLALADLAAEHGGHRAAASPGYDASVEYVAAALAAAGLSVRRQSFTYAHFELRSARLAQAAPASVEYAEGADFRVAAFSGAGDVQAPVVAVDMSLGPGNESTSGCEEADFAGFPAGSVALLQRGSCEYDDKLAHAVAAGASAAVIFNQGNSEARSGMFTPRLSPGVDLPVVGVSYALGVAWSELAGLELRVSVDAATLERATENIFGETAATASGRVVMLGAHLDSVAEGPGVNDNGSGSAALLALTEALRGCGPRHQVRLAFWGAEELGLLGSAHYVESLTEAERDAIDVYLNLDMIASPNPTRFVYDGDGSAYERAGPGASAAIEAALTDYFKARDLPVRETPFDGRSDYGPFLAHGVACGGIFTGAGALKTEDEAAVFGGAAGVAHDPCYHQACDDRDNYSAAALVENTRAAAHVAELFAARAEELSTGTGTSAP